MIPVLGVTLVLVPPPALLRHSLALPVVGLVTRGEPQAVLVVGVTVGVFIHRVVDPLAADNVTVRPGKVTRIIRRL